MCGAARTRPRGGPSGPRGRLGDGAVGGEQRQPGRGEESRGADLAVVERHVALARPGVQRVERHLGLAQQQPADDADRRARAAAGRCSARPCRPRAASAAAPVEEADHRAQRSPARPRARSRAARARPPARRCRRHSWRTSRSRVDQRGQRLTLVADDLAEEQVGRLDRRWCPRRSCRSWRRAGTARSGSPAGNPEPPSVCSDSASMLVRALGPDALDERQQQVVERARRRRPRAPATAASSTESCSARGPQQQRPQALGVRLLQQQHPAHVRVVGDRHPRRAASVMPGRGRRPARASSRTPAR